MDRASVHIDLSYQFETDQQVVRNISKPTACDNFMSVMFHALFLAQVVASKILQGSSTYAISTTKIPTYNMRTLCDMIFANPKIRVMQGL